MKIKVSHNFDKLKLLLSAIPEVALKKSVVRSVNRAANTMRKEGSKEVRKVYRLKSGEVKERIKIDKATYKKASNFGALSSKVRASDDNIPLIRFVVGSQMPREQAGIKVKQRQRIRVRVGTGKSVKIERGFIAKMGKQHQVYKRVRPGRYGFKRQSLTSVYGLMGKPVVREKLTDIIAERYLKEMSHNIPFYIEAERKKYLNKRLTK